MQLFAVIHLKIGCLHLFLLVLFLKGKYVFIYKMDFGFSFI